MAINLLPEKVRRGKREESVKRASTWGAVALLIGVVAVLAGVLVFKMILSREVGRLESQIEDSKKRIGAQEELEIKARSLEGKVKALESILGEKEHYSVFLEGLSAVLPSGIALTDLRVDSPVLAGISGTAVSYIDLARFLEAVGSTPRSRPVGTQGPAGQIGLAAESGGLFSKVRLRSVNLDTQTGQVKFDLDLVVRKGALRYGQSQ